MIKDEDHRIEHWKKLLKVQEQALLDRTRGELIYLEMQRKYVSWSLKNSSFLISITFQTIN